MSTPAYVAVDWGTSSFRLWLMDEDGKALAERRSDEGMTAAARTGFSIVLSAHLQAVAAPGELPVVICGMAGARQGWVEAGYADTPTSLSAILDGAVRVPGEERDIRILPGIAQRAENAPDVMRGEETQLLGALDSLGGGSHIVCMPGTHSKWVRVSDATVSGYATFMTGELFEVMSNHSILAHSVAGADAYDGDNPAFANAVETVFGQPQMASNLLFTIRAGQLLHNLAPTDAQARLSGLLIGLEIAGALSQRSEDAAISLVASGRLNALYQAAFRTLALDFTKIDADAAVRRGLSVAARHIFPSARTRNSA